MPMRKLRRCDFCGGDAAGVYEVLPPELSPTEAEQRRVVLCSDCADTLETVVDPLLDRLGVGPDGDASATDTGEEGRSVAAEVAAGDGADGDGDGERSAEGLDGDADTGTPDRQPTGGRSDHDDPDEGAVRVDEAAPTDDGAADGPAGRQSDPARDGDPGDDTSDGVDPTPAGVGGAISTGTDGATPEPPAADETDDAAADGTDTDDTTGGSAADDADDAAGTAGATGGSTGAATAPDDEPEEFRTVMRLLGNREFPVERGAIVELAAGAYELDKKHVHRIVDHAIDRGVIEEDGGTLRRG